MYLCKAPLSILIIVEDKKYLRTQKNIKVSPYPAVSKVQPRFNTLYKNKQVCPSQKNGMISNIILNSV